MEEVDNEFFFENILEDDSVNDVKAHYIVPGDEHVRLTLMWREEKSAFTWMRTLLVVGIFLRRLALLTNEPAFF
jgi:hypothetical protein